MYISPHSSQIRIVCNIYFIVLRTAFENTHFKYITVPIGSPILLLPNWWMQWPTVGATYGRNAKMPKSAKAVLNKIHCYIGMHSNSGYTTDSKDCRIYQAVVYDPNLDQSRDITRSMLKILGPNASITGYNDYPSNNQSGHCSGLTWSEIYNFVTVAVKNPLTNPRKFILRQFNVA